MKAIDHLKVKAIEFRENGYSLNEICKRLNKGKSTVFYWIKDVQIIKKNAFLKKCQKNLTKSAIEASKATRAKYKRIHNYYRDKALLLWNDSLRHDDNFKQFIMMYSCEGDRKSKFSVALCNSDPDIMRYCQGWFHAINIHHKKFEYNIQLHIDQNEKEILSYWGKILNIVDIRISRKSNTGKMHKRNWNSKYGVITIRFCDSYLKTMINTWGELLKKEIGTKKEFTDLTTLNLIYNMDIT